MKLIATTHFYVKLTKQSEFRVPVELVFFYTVIFEKKFYQILKIVCFRYLKILILFVIFVGKILFNV